jgi:hypothetical protein
MVVETMSPGSRNDTICRLPSDNVMIAAAQPLQITCTVSCWSCSRQIIRLAGTVWPDCSIPIGLAREIVSTSAAARQMLSSKPKHAAQADFFSGTSAIAGRIPVWAVIKVSGVPPKNCKGQATLAASRNRSAF